MKKINFRTSGLCLILAIFSGLIGFMIAAANNTIFDDHHPATPIEMHDTNNKTSMKQNADHLKMHNNPVYIPDNIAVPSIEAIIHNDSISGVNLQLIIENFTFTPESAGFDHIDGTGHAHLYLDERKIARLYGNWFHIEKIPEGTKQIRVTLNSNNHRPLFANGGIISSVIELKTRP